MLRAAPPSFLRREGFYSDHGREVAQELQAVSQNQVESDDDSDDDGSTRRRKVEKKGGALFARGFKRAAGRRACLVLGQVKAKRLHALLEARPEVHGAPQSSCAFLPRGARTKGEDAPADACDAATAF